MRKDSINIRIINFILINYKLDMPILIKDIYNAFPDVNENTIRSIINRFDEKEIIVKINNGVYALPNKGSIMGKPAVYTFDIIRKKYIDDNKRIIGYTTGLSFANQLGLTTQTASVETVISNAVSNKKREIKLNKNRFILNAPRVKVSNENYKLLQVLDLLNGFDRLSEVSLKSATKNILKYISSLNLNEDEMDQIVTSYPLGAQVKFYKIGGQNVIASK